METDRRGAVPLVVAMVIKDPRRDPEAREGLRSVIGNKSIDSPRVELMDLFPRTRVPLLRATAPGSPRCNLVRTKSARVGARRSLQIISAWFSLLVPASGAASGVPSGTVHHPSQYEENRLDRSSQLALDASLSDVVLIAAIRGVTTLPIPVDTTGNAFLPVPLYSLEVQRSLKGNVALTTIEVMGTQHDAPLPAEVVGSDAAPVICFLRDLEPVTAAPTPTQRARSQYHGFMRHGVTSRQGYLLPPPDSLEVFASVLTAAIQAQSVERLAATAEVVLVASVAEGVLDCGLPKRRRYCQEARVTEVFAGGVSDSLIRVTSHFMRGMRKGLNVLFLRRLEGGTYQVEGAAAGIWWLEDPAHPGMASQLGQVRQIVRRRQDSRR